jgi:hypothetical protein
VFSSILLYFVKFTPKLNVIYKIYEEYNKKSSDIQCDSNKVYKLEDVPSTRASDSQLQLPAFMTISLHIMFESEG